MYRGMTIALQDTGVFFECSTEVEVSGQGDIELEGDRELVGGVDTDDVGCSHLEDVACPGVWAKLDCLTAENATLTEDNAFLLRRTAGGGIHPIHLSDIHPIHLSAIV